MINKDEILMDKAGYDKLLAEIEAIKAKINEVNSGRREAYDAGSGDGWDSPEFEEIERVENVLLGELKSKCDQLTRAKIIEKSDNVDLVDIGDIILAVFTDPSNKSNELKFKLVGGNGDLFAEIQEVSVNSPMGIAVYKKKVGDICNYSVNNNNYTVEIKEKLNLTKEDDTLIKTLNK